jgi:ABC-type transport system substrate-binding protein
MATSVMVPSWQCAIVETPHQTSDHEGGLSMSRVRYVVPAALALLLSGVVPAGLRAAMPMAQQRFSGTVTVELGYTPRVSIFGINPFGAPPLIDAPLALDEHGRYIADLATAVPSTANGGIRLVGGNTVVTVQLKQGQRWSNGSPITPADYVGAMLVDYSPDASFQLCQGAPRIATMTASASAVVLTFRGSYGPVLNACVPYPIPMEYLQHKYGVRLPATLLSTFHAPQVTAFYRSPSYARSSLATLVTKLENDPYDSPADVFNGPYKVSRFQANVGVRLVANPYYTALPPTPGHPRPASIQYVTGSADPAVLAQSLASPATYRRIDLATDLATDMRPLRHTSYRIILVPSGGFELLQFNLANPALRDVRVRQALNEAIDKVAYLRALFPGVTTAELHALLQASPVPSPSPWSDNGQLPQNSYNPARARALLAAAGYAGGTGRHGKVLRLEFYAPSTIRRATSARLLQQFWEAIGITVHLHLLPTFGVNGLLSSYSEGGVLARRHFDIAQFGLVEFPDPEDLLLSFDPSQIPDQNQPNGGNLGGVRDLTLLRYLTEAQNSLDQQQRVHLYDQAQRRIVAQAYWIPLYNNVVFCAVKATLGNVKLSSFASVDWNAFEWYRTAGT